jgi:tRNA threonylcarbamoyladenosine biosynthesis protein TsaE
MNEIISVSSLEGLPQAAQKVLNCIGNDRIVAFYGAMGAGKTTLIKALCSILGVTDQVNSPTFTLINEYKSNAGRMIYHFDFYRIGQIEDAYDLGYDEYFDSQWICLIEWPELIEELLPEDVVRVYIRELTDHTREIVIKKRVSS